MFALTCSAVVSVAAYKTPVTMGSVTSTSPTFPYVVSIASLLTRYCPEYLISVSENDGNLDNSMEIRSGEVQIASCASYTDYENYNGVGPTFGGDPFKDFRILWYNDIAMLHICVANDSGIESIRDLDGRPFSSGGAGTTASCLIHALFDALGVHPDYKDDLRQPEALEAYITGKIDGVAKLGPVPDAYVSFINSARPIRMLPILEEDIDIVFEALPIVKSAVMSANLYDGVDYYTRCLFIYHGLQSNMSFSQKDGYRFFKAMWEDGKRIWQSAYQVGAGNDVPALTLQGAVTPLHAGTVQYLVEHGYSVSENLIPEEYVPSR